MSHVIFPQTLANSAIAPAQLGGKAASLAYLDSYHLPIPPWCVLLPSAFIASLTDEQQQQWNQGIVPTDLQLAPTIQDELAIALAHLAPQQEPVAVRSSALEEDGTQHSFAGQLDSFLNVPIPTVAARVVDVWRSAFSDRLLAYRREHHLNGLPTPPAVLIQRMVQAEVAGVAFSANPITGQRGIATIAAVRGLGDALVSGAVEGDTYQVDRTGRVVHHHTLTPTPLLADPELHQIVDLVRRVEACSDRPQDIEWALAEGRLYLLQARPITAIASLSDPDGPLTLWDNSNIAESYGGVTTPLTFSFARRAYEAVYRQFCRLMGVSETAIAHHDATFQCMIGLIRGRMYYNLLNWYRVLALLPGFTVNRRFMEQMMGVKEELPADVLATLSRASWGDRLTDGWHLFTAVLGLLRNGITLPRQIRRFYRRLDDALKLPLTQLSSLRSDELVAYYRNLEQQLLTRWDAPLVNDFFAMIFYGLLQKLTVKWCGDQDGTLQNHLISGEGGMISAEPAHCIQRMAQSIRDDRPFVHLLCEGTLPAIQAALPQRVAFQAQYEDYLKRFGDRCLEELKLESPTLHDDPLMLLRSVGRLASTQFQPQISRDHPQDGLRQQAERQVQQALRHHPGRSLLFRWVLHNARRRVRDRENLRFERTRVFGRVRRIMLELGRRFYAVNALAHPRDVFYLTLEEVLGFVDGTIASTQLKGVVALRQEEFQHYGTQPPPPDRFQTHGAIHPLIPHLSPNRRPAAALLSNLPAPDKTQEPFIVLQGTGCCPGIVRAPVHIITDPKQAQLQPGSILVAERTDPGWIMLFPAAAGVLVERGSLLSHSAIVARELGIPAIVSIAGVTRSLQTGDWVEMNGTTGRVHVLPAAIAEATLQPTELT